MSFPIRGWRSILIFCWMNGGPPALCLKLSQRPRCWDRVSQELATTRRLFSPLDLKRYYHCLVKPPLDQKISTWKTITGRLLAGSLPLFKTRSWWLRLHVTSYIM